VVQVVPTGERPTALPEPVASSAPDKEGWPRIVKASVTHTADVKTVLHHRIKKAHARRHRPAAVASAPKSHYVASWDWPQQRF